MKLTTPQETAPTTDRPAPESFIAPMVNIFENKDGYVLEAELPGVNKDGLEITLEDNELTLVGRRHVEPLPGNALFRESRDASFRRVFQIDPAVDAGRIAAKIDQGVLRLTLPKSEKVKPRKIVVN